MRKYLNSDYKNIVYKVMNHPVLSPIQNQVDNMAREGLRTLVVAKKSLTQEQYADFEQRYNAAKLSLENRSAQVAMVKESLERDMDLLCVTGVEDKLQGG